MAVHASALCVINNNDILYTVDAFQLLLNERPQSSVPHQC